MISAPVASVPPTRAAVVREDLPNLATLPATRVKMDGKGNLQVRAGNVTGPSGVRFSRVEIQFEPDSAKHTIVAVRAGEQKETRFDGAAFDDGAGMRAIFALVDTLVARGYSTELKMKLPALDALCELQELGKHGGALVAVEPALLRELGRARVVYDQQLERLVDTRDLPAPSGPLTPQQARSHKDAAKPYQHRLGHVTRARAHMQRVERIVAEQEAEFAAVVAAANAPAPAAAPTRTSGRSRFADAALNDRSPAERADARRTSPWGRLSAWVSDKMRALFG